MLCSFDWLLFTDVLGQPVNSIFNGQPVQENILLGTVRPLKMGQISCTETSVNNYQSKLRNILEERRSYTVAEVWNHSKLQKKAEKFL
jgi:hypothetical protein